MLAASCCFLWLAVTQGLGLALATVIVVVNIAVFKLLNRISTWVFRRTRIVLLEHLLLTLMLTMAIMMLGAAPLAAGLDAWILAMSLFLFFGRIGCLFAGCCHGQPSAVGVKYPWLIWAYAPKALHQVSLIPVQAFESILLAAIFISSLALFFAPHYPGDLLVLFIACYGAGRFGLEFLRGDARPYFLRLSESQWIVLGLILAMITTSLINAGPHSSLWLVICGASLVVITLLTIAARGRLGRPIIRISQKRDIECIAAGVKDIWKTALANLSLSDEQACRAKALTSHGLHLELEVILENGYLVERYAFCGQQTRLLENAARVVAIVIQDFRGAGDIAGQFEKQARGCYSLVRRVDPRIASDEDASFTSALIAMLATGSSSERGGHKERLQKARLITEQFEDRCGQIELARESHFRARMSLARFLVERAGYTWPLKEKATRA